jgi:putative endonuclease
MASSGNRTLQVGVAPDLTRLVTGDRPLRLVYAEPFLSPMEAIRREKQLKAWTRERKAALIEAANPNWSDWFALPIQPKKK